MRNTFSREEKLKSKKLIDQLFGKGNRLFSHPFLLFWDKVPSPGPEAKTQVLISVSKKTARKAVARNKLKRQMREAYRLNKHILAPGPVNEQLAIAIVLVSADNISYDLMNRKLVLLLRQLQGASTGKKE